jgi:hypothetical protein
MFDSESHCTSERRCLHAVGTETEIEKNAGRWTGCARTTISPFAMRSKVVNDPSELAGGGPNAQIDAMFPDVRQSGFEMKVSTD